MRNGLCPELQGNCASCQVTDVLFVRIRVMDADIVQENYMNANLRITHNAR